MIILIRQLLDWAEAQIGLGIMAMPTEGEYRTVTQDDILDKECLRKNAGRFVLYSYGSEDLEQGEYLDKRLTQLACLCRGCKFLRVEGSLLAPLLIARKLHVKKFPTIVAMNNGNFKNCFSDMEGKNEGFVQECFFMTGFVNSLLIGAQY